MARKGVIPGLKVPIYPYGPYILVSEVKLGEAEDPKEALVVAVDPYFGVGIKVKDRVFIEAGFTYKARYEVEGKMFYLISCEDVLGWAGDTPAALKGFI